MGMGLAMLVLAGTACGGSSGRELQLVAFNWSTGAVVELTVNGETEVIELDENESATRFQTFDGDFDISITITNTGSDGEVICGIKGFGDGPDVENAAGRSVSCNASGTIDGDSFTVQSSTAGVG